MLPGDSRQELSGTVVDKRLYLSTLGNGIRIIEQLSARAMGMRELSESLGLNRSATYRLVHTLIAHGIVRQEPRSNIYSLTPRLWEWGLPVVNAIPAPPLAQQKVRALADEFGEAVHLSLYDNGEVVYIDKADGWQPIRSYIRRGGRAPAHAIATGKALLAAQPEAELTRLLDRGLVRYTSSTLVSEIDLRAQLESIRRDGFAFNNGEWHEGVAGIAVSITNPVDGTVTALGISGPTERLVETKDAMVTALVRAKEAIRSEADSSQDGR